MDCPYCSLKASDQTVVLRDDLVWFVKDRRYEGSLKHSGVIIPVAHRETVFDLTEPEAAATFREFSPDGYNVGWNCGRVGGQELLHAHLHVIPRFRQEPLAGHGIRSHLKSEANRR
jgi:diadenosine tetraphosphate (Ap4A) HIT family hydrolase